MNLQEILAGGGGVLLLLLTLVQIAPIKINPWSALAKIFGRAINTDVLKDLDEVKRGQIENRKCLNDHIRIDDERNADLHRFRILQFNTELLRDIKHTKEDFTEVLSEIDFYEHYCSSHPDYENNRAICAIENIKAVYKERLQKHDFL